MKIFLLSHSSGLKGPINFLEDYLEGMHYEMYHLEHPLDTYIGKYTTFSKNGKNVFTIKRFGGSMSNLFLDIFLSLRTMQGHTIDVFIGGNNFDTVPAIILRKLFFKKIKKIIYFSSDFSENRYKNLFLNKVYLLVEQFALKYADLTVSNTNRAERKRNLLGLIKKKSLVISNGVYLKNNTFPAKVIKKDLFIYVGNVTQEHGIYDFVVKLKKIIKKLVIIGQGDQWDMLKKYCESNHIPHEFFYKKSHEETIAYLQRFNGFGLAPYTADAQWTWYSSPLKVNEYIACGVPVIVSDIPEVSMIVDKEKLGIVYVSSDKEKVIRKLKAFDTKLFNKKAEMFYTNYSYSSLYKKLPV